MAKLETNWKKVSIFQSHSYGYFTFCINNSHGRNSQLFLHCQFFITAVSRLDLKQKTEWILRIAFLNSLYLYLSLSVSFSLSFNALFLVSKIKILKVNASFFQYCKYRKKSRSLSQILWKSVKNMLLLLRFYFSLLTLFTVLGASWKRKIIFNITFQCWGCVNNRSPRKNWAEPMLFIFVPLW